MGKSSYSTKAALGALALMGYLAPLNSAEAQHVHTKQKADFQAQQPVRQDRVFSGKECLSAAGSAIYLVNYCHDLDFRRDSKIGVKQEYDLSTSLGSTLTYSAYSAKEGAKIGINRLKTFKPFTDRDSATMKFLQKLERNLPKNDYASVSELGSAVRDGVLEGSELIGKVSPGMYAIMSTSSNNSLPQFVNIRYDTERARLDSISRKAQEEKQRAAYLTENANRVKNAADSAAKSVRDSIAKLPKEGQDTTKKPAALTKTKTGKEKENYDWLTGKRFGLETGYGSNNGAFVGAYVKVFSAPKLSVGFYAQYNVSRGDAVADTTTEITLRDKQLIGPATYKERLDEATRISRQENAGEVGLEVLLNPSGRVSIPLRVGLALGNDKTDVNGKSTITFMRNDQVMQDPSVIENSMPTKKKSVNSVVFGAGLDLNVSKHLSVGASYNQNTGKNGSGSVRLNAKVRF